MPSNQVHQGLRPGSAFGRGFFQPKLKPLRALFLLAGISTALTLSCLAPSAAAQNRSELSLLIFEPVLLTADVADNSEVPASADSGPTASPSPNSAEGSVTAGAGVELLEEQDLQVLQGQIQRYRDSISSLSNSSDSLYSEAVREQSYSLALLLAQSGDYEGAIPVLEAAMHIDRVNYGLFTTRQMDLVNQLIQNHDRLGHYEQVADYEEYLYYIQTKSYPEGDPHRIAATEHWADWNVESFLKMGPQDRFGNALSFNASSNSSSPGYVAVQAGNGSVYYVPRDRMPFVFGPTGMPGGVGFRNSQVSDFSLRSSPYTVTPEALMDERLDRAQDIYKELRDKEDASPERKAALQRKLANVSYFVKRQMDSLSSSTYNSSFGFTSNTSFMTNSNPVVSRGYQDNAESLDTAAKDIEADPNASQEIKTQAYLDLGDWHLSFERFSRATEAYRKAWELAGSPDIQGASLHPVLHPDYLVPVPGFVQHPYSREIYGIAPSAKLDYKGYMDVSLRIDRRGRVSHEKIVATSEDASQVLRNALIDYLRDNRMRPFIQNGEAIDAALDLRFYYTY